MRQPVRMMVLRQVEAAAELVIEQSVSGGETESFRAEVLLDLRQTKTPHRQQHFYSRSERGEDAGTTSGEGQSSPRVGSLRQPVQLYRAVLDPSRWRVGRVCGKILSTRSCGYSVSKLAGTAR